MSPVSHQERSRVREALREVFRGAAKKRGERPGTEKRDGEHQLAWVFFEREVMHNAVNEERTRRGLPAVTINDIRRVERMAEGHCDYADKFALYCGEIAIGETPVM